MLLLVGSLIFLLDIAWLINDLRPLAASASAVEASFPANLAAAAMLLAIETFSPPPLIGGDWIY